MQIKIFYVSLLQKIRKNLVTKVRMMYDGLPQWLKTAIVENNKLSLIFKNGSQIKQLLLMNQLVVQSSISTNLRRGCFHR